MQFHITCLRHLASPLIWNPASWDVCAGRALLALAKRIRVAVARVAAEGDPRCSFEDCSAHANRDPGPAFMGILVGEVLAVCEEQPDRCPFVSWVMSWDDVEPIVMFDTRLRPGWEKFMHQRQKLLELGNTSGLHDAYVDFKHQSVSIMIEYNGQADVMAFGPYGYLNEPFFGPSLVFPAKLRVVLLMLKKERFRSSSVVQATFPWALQSEVETGAAFLRDAIAVLRPKNVFPGDSVAVLMMAKCAYQMNQIASSLTPLMRDVVLPILAASIPQPFQYPPPTLSKLIPGHEPFGPKEIVVTDNDGMGEVTPDWVRAKEAMEKLGPCYVKKEYSEAGRGVSSKVLNEELLREGLMKVFDRNDGVGIIDLDLKSRIFLQKEITGPKKPVGFRFYAEGGKVLAGYLGVVDVANVLAGISFITIRSKRVEHSTREFVKAINYTGFGAAWWWRDHDGHPHLIDFNPRLERHACVNAVLLQQNETEQLIRDPCGAYQSILLGKIPRSFYKEKPRLIKKGLRFMEPMRVVNMGMRDVAQIGVELLRSRNSTWNIHKDDVDLWNIHEEEINAYIRRWDEKFSKK